MLCQGPVSSDCAADTPNWSRKASFHERDGDSDHTTSDPRDHVEPGLGGGADRRRGAGETRHRSPACHAARRCRPTVSTRCPPSASGPPGRSTGMRRPKEPFHVGSISANMEEGSERRGFAGGVGAGATDLRAWLQAHDIAAVIRSKRTRAGTMPTARRRTGNGRSSSARSTAASGTGASPPVTRSWPAATSRWSRSPAFWSGSGFQTHPGAIRAKIGWQDLLVRQSF